MPWYDKQLAEMTERRDRIDAIRQRTDDEDLTWLLAEFDKLEAYANTELKSLGEATTNDYFEIERLKKRVAKLERRPR